MSIQIRCLQASEYVALARQILRAFGHDALDDDHEKLRQLLPPERTSCAFDGERLVGTCGAFDLPLAVPGGGVVSMAGTTLVCVEPTHRRRGVLRQMMRAHMDQALERGDPVAGLWASEAEIYPRFGFGAAAQGHQVKVDASRARIVDPDPSLRLRRLDADEALVTLSETYQRIWRVRPGMFRRSHDWWRAHTLRDPPERRQGGSALHHIVCEDDGVVEGYVTYRQINDRASFGHGTLDVKELIASTDQAHGALWSFLFHVDLFPNIRYLNAPPDDELEWRVAGSYALHRTLMDNLWIRILDVPRALSGRRYLSREKIRFRVHDGFGGAASGCYELEAAPTSAVCEAVSGEPDIELSVSALSALYLGRTCVRPMARSGAIQGTQGALTRLERMFAWTREPWCPEIF